MTQNAASGKDNGNVLVGYHVVAVIDILGQKQRLTGWATLPPELKPNPQFLTALRETSGLVLKFREVFEDFFREGSKPVRPQGVDEAVYLEKRALYERYNESRLQTQQFADTFVFYAPLMNTYRDLSVVSVHAILGACGAAMIASLALGFSVRGAVTVGMGMELSDRNFYGPALAEAHCLESSVAEYPRIVVSQDAMRFLQLPGGFSPDKDVEEASRRLLPQCRSLVCQDTDGKIIVDFLGKGMLELHRGVEPSPVEAIERGYRFVCSEMDRLCKSGDEVLAKRYGHLKRYMEARLPIWIDSKELGYD